ncbi:MAG: Nif3-like dinuclear metal center hexameric protein [Anaerovoracaceae bacterium]
MKLEELVAVIEEIAPSKLQEKWDNNGIQIAAGSEDINRILVSLEINDEVIEEAKMDDVDMIITHHPLIFGKLSSVDYRQIPGKYIAKLISLGISVYSSHTPFDKAEGGNNDYLTELIGLKDTSSLSYPDGELESIGRIGQFIVPYTLEQTILLAQERLDLEPEQITAVGNLDTSIKTVAVCTGAGADFIDVARQNGCELLITGDLKYHEAQKAKEIDLCVIDAGHYGTEKFFGENMAMKLIHKLEGQIEVITSVVDLDPFLSIVK